MKATIQMVGAIALAVALLGLSLALLTPAPIWGEGTTLNVAPACGGVPAPCYTSVQAAVDAATVNDLVRVATGVYTDVSFRAGVTQTVYLSKSLTLRGGYSADFSAWDPAVYPTVLDAQNQGRVLYIFGPISVTVEGLRLTGGRVAGTLRGGGLYGISATVTLSGNLIYSNTAYSGGGLCLDNATGRLFNNQVYSNTAGMYGGGVYLRYAPAEVVSHTVRHNSAQYGGGLYVNYATVTVRDSAVLSNTASQAGGGFYVSDDNTRYRPRVLRTLVQGNTAANSDGGGFYLYGGQPYVEASTIRDNSARDQGGGLYLYGALANLTGNVIQGNQVLTNGQGAGLYAWNSPYDDYAVLTNNAVVGNRQGSGGQGAGLYVQDGRFQLYHTTIASNTGGDGVGLYLVSGDAWHAHQLRNVIIVSQTTGISVTSAGILEADFILWYANGANTRGSPGVIANQFTGNPRLAADGYHLTTGSAAKDRGVDFGVYEDIDGQVRPQDAEVDLGADELPGVALDGLHTVNSRYANPNQVLTYTLVVTSVGVSAATNVVITDGTAPELTPLSISADRGTCSLITIPGYGQAGRCLLGNLSPGATARLTMTARVTSVTPTEGVDIFAAAEMVANETVNWALADGILHNCHVRLNDSPEEYLTLQAALEAGSSPTDVVKSYGLCAGVETRGGLVQQVYLSRPVTLQGDWNATFTARSPTLSTTLQVPNWQDGRLILITATTGVTISGYYFTEAEATYLRGGTLTDYREGLGGAVYAHEATATISDCVFYNNRASQAGNGYGGAVGAYRSTLNLLGNTFEDNDAAWSSGNGCGGAVAFSYASGTVAYNLFNRNYGSGTSNGYGGGLWAESSPLTVYSNTFQGNYGSYTYSGEGGGLYLLYSDSALIQENLIIGNRAANGSEGRGGGLNIANSAVTLRDNVIRDNLANAGGTGYGGGLYIGGNGVQMLGNLLFNNRATTSVSAMAGYGGGMILGGSNHWLSGTQIISNAASTAANVPGYGGGLHAWFGTQNIIEALTILSNTASRAGTGYGGGLVLWGDTTQITLSRSLVQQNTPGAGGYGGGIYLYNNASALQNSVIADNRLPAGGLGAGLYISRATPSLVYLTVARNTGGDGSGLYLSAPGTSYSQVTMTNTIVVNQSVGVTATAGNTATLNSVLWHANGSNTGGAGVIQVSNPYTGAPAFLGDGYHLSLTSPAINRGICTNVTTDIDGETRPAGGGCDLGADEALYNPQVTLSKIAAQPIVAPGERLTYTLQLTNTGNVTLTATLTDILPANVSPAGLLTWTTSLSVPGGVWSATVVVTVATGYTGPLTNVAQVTTAEGAGESVTVTTEAQFPAPPLTPTLISPANSSVVTTQTVTLTWAAATGGQPAQGYHISIDGSPFITTSETTSVTVLAYGVHTWTVRAYNGAGASPWAAPWQFTVSEPAPGVPTLITPTDGLSVTASLSYTAALTFTWQPTTTGGTPTGYRLQLWEVTQSGWAITTFTLTQSLSPTVLPVGLYLWSVQAFNAAGESEWSDFWSLWVLPPPPATPVLLSPVDGASLPPQPFDLSWQAGAGGGTPDEYYVLLDGELFTTTETVSPTVAALGVHTWTVSAGNAGGVSGWAAPWTFTVTEGVMYTLTVAKAGSGNGILTPTVGAHTYPSGTIVVVTATAQADSTFIGWSGACSSTSSTCTVTMDANKQVTATFTLLPVSHTLTIATAGNGHGVVTPTVGAHEYLSGTAVVVTATAQADSTFIGWSGACSSTSSTCTVTMDANKQVTATFTLLPVSHTLTIATAGNGHGVVTPTVGAHEYLSGTAVVVTATAQADSTFAGWSGACSGTSPTCTVAMDANKQVTATFTLNGTCTPVGGVDFAFAPAAPRVGQPVWFTGTVAAGDPPLTYNWAWGDGTPGGSGATLSHTFPVTMTAQTYLVTLTVSNPCPSQGSRTQPVTVQPRRIYLPLVLRAW